jgi:hypothetical protein
MGRLADRLAEKRRAAESEEAQVAPDPYAYAYATLTAAEREGLETHAKQLDALCNCTPANNAEAEREALVAVTKMMFVLPHMTQNELSSEARGEACIEAALYDGLGHKGCHQDLVSALVRP